MRKISEVVNHLDKHSVSTVLFIESKQDAVLVPSVQPNLNVLASVNSGTENPYASCVCTSVYRKIK